MKVQKSTWVEVGSGSVDDIYHTMINCEVPEKAGATQLERGIEVDHLLGGATLVENTRIKFEWEDEE